MPKNFRELVDEFSPERKARIRKRTEQLLAELPLQQLRHARELTQGQLAEELGVNQASVSKLERRTDMYISTLRRFIEATGGELELIATFPEGRVRITQLEAVGEDGEERSERR